MDFLVLIFVSRQSWVGSQVVLVSNLYWYENTLLRTGLHRFDIDLRDFTRSRIALNELGNTWIRFHNSQDYVRFAGDVEIELFR